MKKLILFACCISSILSSLSLSSMIYAEEIAYSENTNCITTEGDTSVIKDLLDMKFQLRGFSDFQNLSINQHLNTKNELNTFIYCYSKDASYIPKSVFISTSKKKLSAYDYYESFSEYPLSLVSKTEDGCLTKYSINGLLNLFEEERRYNVSMVHYQHEDEIKAVAFGMEFYFKTKEDQTIDGRFIKKDVVTITDGVIKNYFMYAGLYKEYNAPQGTRNSYNENYYYFFNTDWKIDELYEVDVQYYFFDIFIPAWYRSFGYSYSHLEYSKDIKKYLVDNKVGFYEAELTNNNTLLKDFPLLADARAHSSTVTLGDSGGFTKYFVKNSGKKTKKVKTIIPGTEYIEYTSDTDGFSDVAWFYNSFARRFVEMNNIIDLKNYTYQSGDSFDFTPMKKEFEFAINLESSIRRYYPGVYLAFDESNWGKSPFGIVTGTGIDEACITRLKFAKDGVIYNLGAVDSPKHPSPDPVFPVEPAPPENDDSKKDRWRLILAIILSISGLYMIYSFITWIVSLFKPRKRGGKRA